MQLNKSVLKSRHSGCFQHEEFKAANKLNEREKNEQEAINYYYLWIAFFLSSFCPEPLLVILSRMGKKDLERGDIHASSDEEDHIELSEEEALKKKAEEEEAPF